MRIIAGKYGGRIVKFPKSDLVRPTTDKVKESLFNYLFNQIDFDGIKVCDIYGGSGALGLESLSRGASEVHFVEKNFKVAKMLKENIKSLKADIECTVFNMDGLRFSKRENHEKYDLILADPPFFHYDVHDVLGNLLKFNFLSENGRIIIERSIQTRAKDKEAFGIEPFKKIGDSLIYEFFEQG